MAGLLFALTIIAFLPLVSGDNFRVAAQVDALPVPPGTPAAVIKRVTPLNSTGTSRATVSRSGSTATVENGLLLYFGDVIETDDAKITVMFLDEPVAERDNEVIIDANSRVRISSTYSWWGTVWAKVKGVFSSKTTYAQAGATGTEYEFTVINPTHDLESAESAWLVVLEGSVEITKDPAQLRSQLFPLIFPKNDPRPSFILASFTSPFMQERYTRTLDVPAGEVTTVLPTYHLFNECRQPHQVEFRLSDNTKWLTLDGARLVTLQGQQTLDVPLQLLIDARQLSQGRHEAHVYAVCLDCVTEARCPAQQLDFGLSINVTPGAGPRQTPTPLPTPLATPTATPAPSPGASSNQRFAVQRLQHSMVTRGFDRPTMAQPSQVQEILTWTNQVLLRAQPSYSARNLIPHFNTIQERTQDFISAREQSIRSGAAASHATLGDVYSDWGQGAWASFAYEKAIDPARPSSTSNANLAEAYRLAGRLDDATKQVSSLPVTIRSQNVLGNLALDRARIALDARRYAEADAQLEQAKNYYSAGLKSQSSIQSQPGPRQAMAAVQANISEANLIDGELALQQNDVANANFIFGATVAALSVSQNVTQLYPFPVTDLGVAYRGLGDAAMLRGDRAAAASLYDRAKKQHQQAITTHQDFAEAYFNLGDLFEDIGDLTSAKANYWLAVKARPEQPAAYYPLAVLLQDENPALAAAMAATYLKIQPAIFNQGEKGRNAAKIARGDRVIPPPRVGKGAGVITETRVPDVVNLTQSEAVRALSAAGYQLGRIEARADARFGEVVLEQRPLARTVAARGSAVDLVINRTPNTNLLVPDVLGNPRATARAAIESAGFTVGKIEVKDDKHPKDTIIKQTPTAGKRADRGTPVDLVISGGRLIEVPDLIGKGEGEVRNKLKGELVLGKVEREASCKSTGKVLSQNPRKDTKVEPGSRIDITVASLGMDALRIPRFTNRAAAEAFVQNNGLNLRRVRLEETDSSPEGSVLQQAPKPGSQYARNCAVDVDLTIAIPIVWVDVGNYLGLSVDDARQQIRAVDLRVTTITQQNANAPAGTVIGQSPKAGSRLQHGKSVTLTVASNATPPPPPPPPPQNEAEVPPLCKMELQAARDQLKFYGLINTDADLIPMPPNQQACGAGSLGQVMWQSPPAGTKVPKGTHIKLVLVPIGDN